MITNKITKLKGLQAGLKGDLLDYSSRYSDSEMIYYSDFDILTFETYEKKINREKMRIQDISKIDRDVKYYVITKGSQYKPWLVSDEAYNDSGYWWLIMEFNDIFDIEDFEAGKTIKIPSLTALALIRSN